MKHVIGITGSISTGKSYVSSYIKKLGYNVLDADEICHELEDYNMPGYLAIEKHFDVIENGKINRTKLGDIIFSSPDKRKLLNSLIHPLVKNELQGRINESNDEIIFIDVPLLFEASFDDICDKVICVSTPKDIQIKRLMARDKLNYEKALKRIEAQMPLAFKEKKSDYIINSDEDFLVTNKNIIEVIERIKKNYA